MRVCGMRTGITIEVSAADRARLEAIVADRNSPQKHVWRAVPLSSELRRASDQTSDGHVAERTPTPAPDGAR